MSSREKHKRGGRPRGSSKKLDEARALIEQGVEPLQALMRTGYSDPQRAYKHHVALIAKARTQADPFATLKHIAQMGETKERIRACEALLSFVPDESLSSKGRPSSARSTRARSSPSSVATVVFTQSLRKWLKRRSIRRALH